VSEQSPSARLEHRAAEIEAAVTRAAARFEEIPVTETVILRLLMLLGREISAILEQSLRPHGLPDGVAHPGDLCAFVSQSPANMTRVADGLHERGLITRVASEEDRRRTILRITPAGEALALALLPQMTAQTRALFEPTSAAEREALLLKLRALIVQVDRCTQPIPEPVAMAQGEVL
jgi:MarR family transcriptional repressor of emrRAB